MFDKLGNIKREEKEKSTAIEKQGRNIEITESVFNSEGGEGQGVRILASLRCSALECIDDTGMTLARIYVDIRYVRTHWYSRGTPVAESTNVVCDVVQAGVRRVCTYATRRNSEREANGGRP